MKYSDKTVCEVADECGLKGTAWVRAILGALESTDEQKALRADAERYRWLRSHGYKDSIGSNPCVMYGAGITQTMPELLDKAIDEARGSMIVR